MKQAIHLLAHRIEDPTKGLPEEVFLFVSSITPMINVDLLIKDEQGKTLLTWRDDGFFPPGWHIPGGIIRYKETIDERVCAVALNELGCKVQYQPVPLVLNEVIHPDRKIRGHFISLLYTCSLISSLDGKMMYIEGKPKPGEWAWHSCCPDNLIAVHEMYRKYI